LLGLDSSGAGVIIELKRAPSQREAIARVRFLAGRPRGSGPTRNRCNLPPWEEARPLSRGSLDEHLCDRVGTAAAQFTTEGIRRH
jgi:hypothetical protein